MRAFFCLDLDDETKGQLNEQIHPLKRLPVNVKWVPPENMHITMVFLGDVDHELVPDLEATAQQALEETGLDGPIDVTLDRLGAFPNVHKPRVVWAGCTNDPQPVKRLARSLESALEPLGFEPEDRPFTTHVTLGRVKERGRTQGTRELTEAIENHEPFRYDLQISQLTLMQSQLGPQGPEYRPVLQIPLGER
ncbi:MAG: RNA 2',3'-cyclic phosphodiesterase [Candidatus Bipolaricaulia bacterium]